MELTLRNQMEWIYLLEKQAWDMVEERPWEVYFIANQLDKLASKLKEATKTGFKDWYDNYKTLPEWYDVRITTRKTYALEENNEYARRKKLLDELGDIIKNATDQADKWNVVVDGNWEIIEPVKVTYNEIYSIIKT